MVKPTVAELATLSRGTVLRVDLTDARGHEHAVATVHLHAATVARLNADFGSLSIHRGWRHSYSVTSFMRFSSEPCLKNNAKSASSV